MKLEKYLAVLALCFFFSCGKDEKSGAASDVDPESVNPMANLVPEGISIPSFPVDSGASLALGDDSETIDDPDAKKDMAERKKEQRQRLRGEGTCLDLKIFKDVKEEAVSCYDFDSDMNPMTKDGKSTGTTTGKHSNDEACMVAFARSQMNTVKAMVDRAMGLVNGLACQALKNGDTELPAVGEEKNVASVLTDASEAGAAALGLGSDQAPEIKVATVKRESDTEFTTTLTLNNPKGKSMTLVVKNNSSADGDSGIIRMERESEASERLNDGGNNVANKVFVMSLKYKQVKATNQLKAELRHAALEKTLTLFNADGTVALEGLAENAANTVVHAIKYLAFDLNTETMEGQLSYWRNPGGSLSESARGFLFDMSLSDDGVLKGCGVSGATQDVSVRGHLATPTTKILKPVRYWHPFHSQNTNASKNSTDFSAQEGAFISKQCFKRDASTGLYLIDTAVTTSAKGYEVIPQAQSTIAPPAKPE